MKYLVIVFLCAPFLAFAHVSDQRYVDGYIIDLSTAPVAPWVGEKVGMSFVFRDPLTGLATSSVVSAHLEIDALMRPNSKVMEVVYESSSTPVVSGGLVTSYVFAEEGTFDVHIAFVDDKGVSHLTGFRKQIRTGESAQQRHIGPGLFFGTVTLLTTLGFFAGKLSRPKSTYK